MLSDKQYGCRKERGTIHAVYVPEAAVEKEIENERGRAFIIFADMKAAFDKIKRGEI